MNDITKGDVVLYTEPVFEGSYPRVTYSHDRTILALVLKESYGTKGQHTFTLRVIDCDDPALDAGENITRKGRNVYKECRGIQLSSQEQRQQKHSRKEDATESKYWEWYREAHDEGKTWKMEKIPSWFLKKHGLENN